MYIVFAIGILIIGYQLYVLIKTKSKIDQANYLLAKYKHKSKIGGFYISIMFNILLNVTPIVNKNLRYFLWVSPVLVGFSLNAFIKLREIELFDTGIQIFGDFVEWRNIDKLEFDKDEIKIVTKDKDPLYYTVSKLEKSMECYKKIQELTPHISSVELFS